MKIEEYPTVKVKIKDIKLDGDNPNAMDKRMNERLNDSMEEFGNAQDIVVDKETMILADGEHRLRYYLQNGIDEIPAKLIPFKSDSHRRAFRQAANKIHGEHDQELDMKEYEKIIKDESKWLLNMVSGESLSEVESHLRRQELADKEEDFDEEDAVEQQSEQPLWIKSGDVYKLGNHVLMCGDSTSTEDVGVLMGENKSDMCFTDPPYLMDFNGNVHADGSKSFNAKHGKIKNDKMSDKDGDIFLDKINNIIKLYNDGAFYVTFYRLGIDRYYESLKRTGLKCRSLIIWSKGNHTLSNSDYMSKYEPIFYGWCNKHNFYGGKNGMDIWEIDRTKKNDLHPTMKPVELIIKAINDGSKENEIILDLFGGSGSTLIACEKTFRKCRMMEIEPLYCQVIIKRWEEFTGNKAVKLN